MKKSFFTVGLTLFAGFALANSSNYIKANLIMKNVHSTVNAGTWFSLSLRDGLNPAGGTQRFTATLNDQIYNKNFTEGLIPAKAIISGIYKNDGKSCSFEIDSISFKGTDIALQPGAYTTVNASLPNQSECDSSMNYNAGQLLEFQTKVDIPDLTPISYTKDYIVQSTPDNFVQAYGNSDYYITGITKFTNGLMQVKVKFNDLSLKDKLVPVYYDDLGLPHCLNFTFMATEDGALDQLNNTYSYLVLGHYNNFGFGVLDN
jgi:hypothetical protein